MNNPEKAIRVEQLCLMDQEELIKEILELENHLNYYKTKSERSLPYKKTCSQCNHFERCSKLVGEKEDWTECDFYPIRFKEIYENK